ncbi:MAG: hypothetical protein FJY79_11300 [Candidatus Aminicenantes bacterium]|nr:hypothetical protein [Candidatus Aminicenantes bacterium]
MNKNTTKRAALALAAFALLAVAPAQAQDAKPFLGAWKGSLSIMGMELEIRVDFSLDESKQVKGIIDVVTQGAMGVPLGNIEIKDKAITFMIDHPNVPGEPTFKGTLDATGKKISGEFTQSGYAGTFAIEKE